MRGVVIFLGLLVLLAGGAVAAAQYVPVDLSTLDSVAGAKEFLTSQMALYAGGGAAAFGLLLIIISLATGGKKKPKEKVAKAAPAKAEKVAPTKAEPSRVEPKKANPSQTQRTAAPPQPAPARPAPAAAPQPVAAKPASAAAPPTAKPQASAQPPAGVAPTTAPQGDPRMMNRKRIQDLVTINDAVKAYRDKYGAYPKADGLGGAAARGAAWIPGLIPDFLPELPRDPAMSGDRSGPQYVYASNGADYKLLAQGVSLIGSANVEVLGVRIDPTRNPTAESASFGFWTEGFAKA